jgi:hypothetical protein
LRRGLCRRCYKRSRDAQEPPPAPAQIAEAATSRAPSDPTAAYPGSEAKITILERRQAERVPLWHPLDVPLELEPDRPAELPPGLSPEAIKALRIRELPARRLSPPDPV